ncbi:MAG: SDR family NAD(P)-dependent oxidoreductase [Planctomycetota bacterium]|jgi:NAD(P)-dependent dehydrogenase (short-subunit alcohol dehydrogenase family)
MDEQADLRGRRVLVTGASRRLGRAVAETLAASGMDVVVHYRGDEAGAREVVEAVRATGVRSEALQADLSDAQACADLVERATDVLGGLDALVNNAAMFERTPLETMSAEDFDRHMAVNGRAVYLLSLHAGRRFKAQGAGTIVNLADVAGLRPWPAYVPYSASKAVVVSLTQSMARLLAPEVRVNAVAPGPMLPPAGGTAEEGEAAVAATLLRRWGRPDDVAGAVRYLLAAPYVTGVVLPVDGGRSVAG